MASNSKDLAKLVGDVQKVHGPESIMMASDMPVRPRVSSGSLALDFAVGGGGLPTDRVIEVAGAESSGKSTLGLLAMRNFLDAFPERDALILDTEGKLTRARVEQLVGTERMGRVVLKWPSYIEEATDVYTEMVGSGLISFVLYDSIAGGVPKRVGERSAEVAGGGRDAARLISEFARLAGNFSNRYACCTFGVNQIRTDQEGFHRHTVVGGHGWLHACALRLLLKRGQPKVFDKINGEDVQVGYQAVAKCVKNQLGGIEGRQAWWWVYTVPTERYGFGIDQVDEVARLSVLVGTIEQHGAWYHHPGLPGGKILSRDRLIEAVKASAELRAQLAGQVMDTLKSDGGAAAKAAPVTDPAGDIDESAFGGNILSRPVEEMAGE